MARSAVNSKSEEHYRNIFNSVSDAIILLRLDGTIIEVNRSAAELAGFTPEEMVGRNVSELLTEAISDYLRRRRVRPVVLDHLADSMNENEELGKLLAFYQPPGITAMLCRDAH